VKLTPRFFTPLVELAFAGVPGNKDASKLLPTRGLTAATGELELLRAALFRQL
jgi:hypothetical protein